MRVNSDRSMTVFSHETGPFCVSAHTIAPDPESNYVYFVGGGVIFDAQQIGEVRNLLCVYVITCMFSINGLLLMLEQNCSLANVLQPNCVEGVRCFRSERMSS